MQLLQRLSRALGREQATRELKWMKQSSPNSELLAQMVQRRSVGEPLQYILGLSHFLLKHFFGVILSITR
jgi:methylase of polypeptide subunit release factors